MLLPLQKAVGNLPGGFLHLVLSQKQAAAV